MVYLSGHMFITDEDPLLDFEWQTAERPHEGRSVATGSGSAEVPSNRRLPSGSAYRRFGWSFPGRWAIGCGDGRACHTVSARCRLPALTALAAIHLRGAGPAPIGT